MVKIYISHLPLNDAIATRAHFALWKAGFDTWVDHIYGQGSQKVITEHDEQALRDCGAGLLIMSEATLASRKCTHEWETILEQKKPLYVAVIEPIAPDNLPERSWDRTIPYVDLQDNVDSGLDYLIHAIASTMTHSE